MQSTTTKHLSLSLAVAMTLAAGAQAQIKGPSTGSTPYVLPSAGSNAGTYSIATVDNTGARPDDSFTKIGGGTYSMSGIPDGLGAYDNGNGTFTVLMNHELGSTSGVARDHNVAPAKGAFVSEWIINKNDLSVVAAGDLMKNVYGWNNGTQSSNTSPSTNLSLNRFCSADLPAVSAFSFTDSNNVTYGTTERLFMHGEEGGSTGWQLATVATGANKGNSYVLGKFNLSTNGSGLTGVGAWENALANPTPQLKTVVIGNNDGGTGIMNNSLAVYVGTKQTTGTEVERAGLTNGTLKFINVTGNPAEIVNTTTRATNIATGSPFTLSSTASTTFSRPEDGAWNPLNPSQYYFVTTDQLDQVSDGIGSQIGKTRLWRLNFSDISNPDAGGTVSLLLDGPVVNGRKVNMFDNLAVGLDGMVYLQEDVGNAAHNGKIYAYNPTTGVTSLIAGHDVSRFGDIGVGPTSPFSADEEASGLINITSIMQGSALNTDPNMQWFLSSDQAHYTTGITAAQVEGGQLFALAVVPEPSTALFGGLIGLTAAFRRSRSRRA